MKENSPPAGGSKVAAATSVASASHGKGIRIKLKKSNLVWGGDGQDAIAALHGSSEEGSWKKISPTNLINRLRAMKRSTPPESPSSREACSPLSRKKKRIKRIHLVPVVKRFSPPLTGPSNSDALSRKKHIIKRIVVVRVTPKRSRRPESPSSNTDGETQSTGDASASIYRKKKIIKRVLDIGQPKVDIASLIFTPARDSCSCHSPTNEPLLEEEFATSKQMMNDSISKPDGVEPANYCVDANPRMDKLIPPASRSKSSSEESTWTQEKMVNIPILATEEKKVLTDHKQEQGPEELQNLLDLDQESIMMKTRFLIEKLNSANVLVFPYTCDEKQQVEVYQRLSRYYIEALKLSSLEKELDDAQSNKDLDPLHVYENIFLKRVEKDPEWYFHPEQCKLAGLDDYQRLVLRDDPMYGDWDEYRLTYHTYRGDLEYVKFREEISVKIKWIEDEAALFGDQRMKNELVALFQSLKIALQFRNIPGRSVMSGFREHINNLRFDFKDRKDLVGLYLELWKRVAKNKVNFGEALRQLYKEDIFPSRKGLIEFALDSCPDTSLIKYNYDTYVDGIDEKLPEEKAHPLITEAVKKMFKKKRNYLDYTRKKLEIAARIGLIPTTA